MTLRSFSLFAGNFHQESYSFFLESGGIIDIFSLARTKRENTLERGKRKEKVRGERKERRITKKEVSGEREEIKK